MRAAGQPGFFDLETCYAELSRNGYPLETLEAAVPWEAFRYWLNKGLKRADKKGADKKGGGRRPFDPVLMFKALVLQLLYTLSGDQSEYQIRDRLSFRRFPGLSMSRKTGWISRTSFSQQDTDARWTKKNNVLHYGDKNHINTYRRFKLIRRYDVTSVTAHEQHGLRDSA